MGGTISIDELKKNIQAWQNQQINNRPQMLPQSPQQLPYMGGLGGLLSKRPALSDYDIELMAICIANKHPQMESSASCFCAMKRLEKGISKD